jgi:hypothetical protein
LERTLALLIECATDKLVDGYDELANAMVAILDNALAVPGAPSE